MKRIKKIFASFGGLVLFGISKIWKNTSLAVDPLYAPPSELYEYNTFINTMEKRLSLGKIIIPILFLIIGLIVYINKKINKKVKIIVVSFIIVLSILGVFLLDHYSKNLSKYFKYNDYLHSKWNRNY